MNINYKMAYLTAGVGSIGSVVVSWLGGWSKDLQTLLILMGIDFLMGILLGLAWKNSTKTQTGALQSRACYKGLIRKGMILLFVLIGHRLDITFATDYIKTGVIIAFMTNELISIVENAGLMGIPMPTIITNSIEVLKGKKEGEVTKNENSN